MRESRVIGIASVLLATALSVPAWGVESAQQAADLAHPGNAKVNPARPGSLNYVEGQASIEGQSLGPEAIGKTELKRGQSLETLVGKAELLLTPGVFFRLGDNSSVTMISPTLTDTELRLDKGEATVEVAELHPENNVVIAEDGAKARLTKTGFYDFDAEHYIVRVYQGEANVAVNGQDIRVENEHQLVFNAGAPMKPDKFDKEQIQDDLYRWSSLRSSYLAEANVDRVQDYRAGNWYGAGWDWDPHYGAYTFIPGDGIFYSPFGWGFYSPFDVGFAPIFFFGDHDFDRDFHHFRDGDHDRNHFDGGEHGDREHFGDRGHGGDGEHHEAHYYDHFDHGSYHGPGHSDHSGFEGGGVVGAGSHGGFHGGHSGEGFQGGGAIGSHGMGGVPGEGAGYVGGGVPGGGAGHVGGGVPGGGAGHVGGGVPGGGAGHVGGGVPGGGGFHGGGGGHAGGGGGGGHR
jgi:FecR protein